MSDLSLLSGVERKLDFGAVRSAFDPQRTSSLIDPGSLRSICCSLPCSKVVGFKYQASTVLRVAWGGGSSSRVWCRGDVAASCPHSIFAKRLECCADRLSKPPNPDVGTLVGSEVDCVHFSLAALSQNARL
jgi:hypothetical protein